MRPLPRRLPSKSAKWAMRVALFTPVLAALSVLAYRGSSVDTQAFLVLLAVVGLLGLLTLFLVVVAFRSLWTHGKRGGRRATWALILAAIVLAPFVFSATLWFTRPLQADLSTDLIDPPVFRAEIAEFGNRAASIVAGELRDGYPAITGRQYEAPLETVLDTVLKQAAAFGWRVVDRSGRIGADDELVIEFMHHTTLLAFPIETVVRIVDEGDTSYLDIRSQMPGLVHDLGTNAHIITEFLREIDLSLIGQVSD
ncbi:DUF1499 domain-containing protein [Ahrensia kielensis]|uniref:DUF1499 domain-containing protein n=1 Tax=Ahrensia kielensis TaxID=76980 RepID=A0ABU9T981_9HYPH